MRTALQDYKQMRLVQKIVGYGLGFVFAGGLNLVMPVWFSAPIGLLVGLAAFAAMEFLWIRPWMQKAEMIADLDAAAQQVRLEREARLRQETGGKEG